ncbi:MAG: hypothetical protein A2086_05750 [Spirochaetes bacterium GWD1_27_9]|nr:MAG: hypothetical protein A2Z98_05975 [Spirochaetes bacterium GWB1_27_13]OHD20267.1 MAG: hypothetical protein A2Y34_15065 [Spirochaetes bacterium GWC1_27_15]OHD35281.1 MAG: hypothetical protein A2086_05750 [Spirochaetes bacterium GWD1_27_9]
MKCDFCGKRNASIRIEEIANNKLREINLCPRCAKINGFDANTNRMNDMFADFLENVFADNMGIKYSLKCPNCGKSFSEISKTEKVGCPDCYPTFKKYLEIIIAENNNSIMYKGKLPSHVNKFRERKNKLEELKVNLNQCLQTEDFVGAAAIRDEIKKMEDNFTRKRNG